MTTCTPPASEPGPPEHVRRTAAPRFEEVAAVLGSDGDPRAACRAVGEALAREGAPLAEALDGLRQTVGSLRGHAPDVGCVEALSLGWSEATLELVHTLSCEDPLTGLASRAHLRARLGELYRQGAGSGQPVHDGHVLVVVDLDEDHVASYRGVELGRALRLLRVCETAREVFAGGETVARTAPGRVVVLTRITPALPMSLVALRRMLADACGTVRAETRPLPPSADGVDGLLRALAGSARRTN